MVDINSLSGISSSQKQIIQRNSERLQAAIAQLVSGSRLNNASDDVASLSLATQFQASTVSLRQISGGLAQAESLLQVADGGIEQIQNGLQQLQSLAQQASSATLSDANRAALNKQFQEVAAEIDRIAGSTSFGGEKLLDGNLIGDKTLSLSQILGSNDEGVQTLSIDSLRITDLFDGRNLNLLSADQVTVAAETISTALGRISNVRAAVGAFQQSVDFAAASIDSVIINQDAARSVLGDTDFLAVATDFSRDSFQANLNLAIAAQSNRLSPTLLKLLG